MKKLIASLLLLLSENILADSHIFDQLDWELNKTKKDIQVLSAEVPGSQFRAYQAITRVEASISDLVAIIHNPATCTDWVYRCGESYRYTQESPNVNLVYTASKMPFPVQDRDTLALKGLKTESRVTSTSLGRKHPPAAPKTASLLSDWSLINKMSSQNQKCTKLIFI